MEGFYRVYYDEIPFEISHVKLTWEEAEWLFFSWILLKNYVLRGKEVQLKT